MSSSCRSVQFLTANHHVMFPEPSAELLMNVSRSRRLIMLLSYAYLEQDWCSNNFRSGSHDADKPKVVLYHMLIVVWLQYTTRGQCCCDKLQRGHCFQTGPSALAGVKSAPHHHHPVGGSVEAHDVRDQGAAQWAPEPPHRTHLEAQLCGKSHHVGANDTIS